MMSYQNINQYNYRKLYLNLIYGEYDICLASDEVDYNMEAIFSPYLIAQSDGNRLPIYIDLNNSGSTQQFTLNYGQYNSGATYISQNYYNPNNLDLINCSTATTICDIGLTGIDNGLVTEFSGETINVMIGLLSDEDKFDRFSFDSRFKMIQVTGYTQSPNIRFSAVTADTLYEVVSATGVTEGYYLDLYGGYLQGFFKLHDYNYQTFPSRVSKGWTMETVVRPRLTDIYFPSSGQTTLNELFPDNAGFFFYMGTRGENKYFHYGSGNPIISGDPFTGYTRVTSPLANCLSTCECDITGLTGNSTCMLIYPQSASTQSQTSSCCGCPPPVIPIEPETDPGYDAFSNALGIKFSGDPSNPKICIRTLTITGSCVTTGTTCTSGMTFMTGYTINEYCTDNPIYWMCSGNTGFTSTERWVQIDLVWERLNYFDDCDLFYRGGLDLITNTDYVLTLKGQGQLMIEPPITTNNTPLETVESISFGTRWFDELQYRLGTLTLYVDGRFFQSWDNVEEIICRPLNCSPELQVGVPFNFSWGGGNFGLKENLIPTGCTDTTILQQDPECLSTLELSGSSLSGLTNDILIEPNFGGTFVGALSKLLIYSYALGADEIAHNFKIFQPFFNFYTPNCPNC